MKLIPVNKNRPRKWNELFYVEWTLHRVQSPHHTTHKLCDLKPVVKALLANTNKCKKI